MKKSIKFILTIIFVITASMLASCDIMEYVEELLHTHDYSVKNVSDEYLMTPATCNDKTVYYFSCSCGEKGTETFEFGEPLDHQFTNYVFNNDAKCGVDGTETAVCDLNCGATDKRVKQNSALQHVYTNYVYNNDALCGVDGTETAVCDHGCGEKHTRTKVNSALTHVYSTYIRNDDGTHVKACMYDNTHTITEDCYGGTATDLLRPVCQGCGGEYGVSLSHKHEFSKQLVVEKYKESSVTCNSPAKYYFSCSCGLKGEETFEYGDTLVHEFTNYVFNNDSFCELDGTETAFCSHGCGEADTRIAVDSKLGHDYGAFVTNGNGTHTRVCTRDQSHTDSGNCTGGEATCLALAHCEACNGAYGEYADHLFTTYQSNDNGTQGALCDSGCGTIHLLMYDGSELDWTKVFNFNEGSITGLTEYGKTLKRITIPEKIGELDVTAISSKAFYSCTLIEILELPESLQTVGDYAFSGCSSITVVDFPSSVKEMGVGVLYGCSKLEKLTVPFVGATKDGDKNNDLGYIFGIGYVPATLKEVTVTGGTVIADNAFLDCKNVLTINLPSSVEKIGEAAFRNCNALKTVTFAEGCKLKVISTLAFSYCYDLQNINIPETVEEIGKNAFYLCKELKYNEKDGLKYLGNKNNLYIYLAKADVVSKAEIDDNCKLIASDVFKDNTSLTQVQIPSGIISVYSNAFYGCTALEKVNYLGTESSWAQINFENVYSNPVYYAKNLYVNGTLLTEIRLTEINGVKNFAFYNLQSATSVEIAESAISFGEKAFYGATSLNKVDYLGTVNQWSQIQFNDESANPVYYGKNLYINGALLTDAKITSVDKILKFAFVNCVELSILELPSTLTSIEEKAFSGCASLNEVKVPESVTEIGYGAFGGCGALVSIELPFIGANEQSSSSAFFGYIFGATNYYDNETVIPASLKNVKILKGKVIANYTFYHCSSITNIILPEELTSIGNYAFSICSSLKELKIPSGVTSIGSRAFMGCSSIETIELPFIGDKKDGSSNTPFGYIFGAYAYGDNALYVPASLKTVKINGDGLVKENAFRGCSSIVNVILSEGITSIGDNAFSGCSSLKEMVLPSTVISIGARAFDGCESLEKVFIPSSVTEIKTSAFIGCTNLSIYCETGQKPSGWNDQWNYASYPVTWGYSEK